MSNANKLKANLDWRRRVNAEIAAGNVVNTTTNAAAFHAAQNALARKLGSIPVSKLNYLNGEEAEPEVVSPNGLRQRLITRSNNHEARAVARPRRGTKCCKGAKCTIMGGRRRKTKRRRNY